MTAPAPRRARRDLTAVDLKHLQALIGVAERGSFSGAAESIGTVQSNVSAHVAKLERELDAVLVDRATCRLTEEGQVVVERARRMLVELEAMVADVMALRQEVTGTVRVGMIGTTGRWLVPQLVARLRARHPLVRMTVADGTSTTLEPQLVQGYLDVAVVTLPVPGDELSARPLFEEDLVLVVPVGHPLARRATPRPAPAKKSGAAEKGKAAGSRTGALPLSALADLELLLPLPGTPARDEIEAAVRPAGITLRPSIELDGLRMLASLTFDGYGPAILPAGAVPNHLRDRFSLLPLEGFPRRHIGVALRRRGLPSAPTKALIELLYEVVADPTAVPDGLFASAVGRR
ncbi:MAG TPA: LysR family transcriptional regulator [Acidimicrobiales bacterium]|nr:LysR family transcriptional regulator [Acidimicrobiales bacterium]